VNPTERIGRLESLLARIKKNVSRPHMRGEKSARPLAQPVASFAQPVAQPVAKAAPAEPTPAPPAVRPMVVPPAAPEPVPSWPPEAPSAVQAAKLSSLPPEELSEDDLLDVTTLPPAPVQEQITHIAAAGVMTGAGEPPAIEVDFETEDEAPASSSRSKVAESLDQALSGAAEQLDDGREIPVKTPPPESGPQEAAPMALEQPGVPELTSLEHDLSPGGPTAEQLGDTIELGVPSRVPIELAPQQSVRSGNIDTPDELEVSLPRRELPSGMYDATLSASTGAEARHEAPAEALPTPPTDRPPVYPNVVPSLSADTTMRPALGGISVARMIPATPAATRGFVELLDESLSL
jgi:hypothetical protein